MGLGAAAPIWANVDPPLEARVQAIVVYCAEFENRSVKKPAARDIFLTRDQYLRVNKCHL